MMGRDSVRVDSGMRRREFISLVGGAAVCWPLAGRAQDRGMPVIGFLGTESPELFAGRLRAFRRGLSETGYVEGRNVAIEYRWAAGNIIRLPELAADLVERRVAVIAAIGGSAPGLAAKAATSTIPIVFETGGDPVKDGLVASMERPGGNVTGATGLALLVEPKRLELLHELVPRASLIGFLINPSNRIAESRVQEMQEPAALQGLRLEVFRAGTKEQLEPAFAAITRLGAGALSVGNSAMFREQRGQLVALAAAHAIPALYEDRDFVAAGGLASYSAGVNDAQRQTGVYVGRILMGERTADLSILQPSKFDLVLNLKTAKTLGLDVPAALRARADELIE
jgi:putative tryptophan/tyrosine transport system substrate-binding protein